MKVGILRNDLVHLIIDRLYDVDIDVRIAAARLLTKFGHSDEHIKSLSELPFEKEEEFFKLILKTETHNCYNDVSEQLKNLDIEFSDYQIFEEAMIQTLEKNIFDPSSLIDIVNHKYLDPSTKRAAIEILLYQRFLRNEKESKINILFAES